MAYSQNAFDFNAFNLAVKDTPAGLKLFLAQKLLQEATSSYMFYGNEHAPVLMNIVQQINVQRASLKAEGETRKRNEDIRKAEAEKLIQGNPTPTES